MRGRAVLATFLVLILVAGFLLVGAGTPVIEAIDVKGGGRIGASNIQTLSGLRLGDRWDAARRAGALASLLDLPQVEDLSIHTRRLSFNRVVVEIDLAEREPFGILVVDGRGLYWADRNGVLIEPLDGTAFLPVLSGIAIDEATGAINSASALDLYQKFYALPGAKLSEFRKAIFHQYFLELITRDERKLVIPHTGIRDSLAKAEVLLRSLEEAEIGGWRVIDLRFEGEVTLTR